MLQEVCRDRKPLWQELRLCNHSKDLVDEEEGVLGAALVHLRSHSWLDNDGDAVVHGRHVVDAEVLLHGWSPHVVLDVHDGHEEDDDACH